MHEQGTGKLDISHLPGPDLVKEAASKGVQQVVEHIQGVHIRILQADPNLPKGHIVLSLSRTINKERLTWTQLQASASPELLVKRWGWMSGRELQQQRTPLTVHLWQALFSLDRVRPAQITLVVRIDPTLPMLA